ncbi:glutamate--tRNA ligase family protein [Streptomyces achromogenes]|uniref:glutamate--tRNA ligase family protein n=1 Tax=Streptomyces achromogenes TaxID=67255 RepID=UPI0036FEFEE6
MSAAHRPEKNTPGRTAGLGTVGRMSVDPVRVRFAPSPTGMFHVGGARSSPGPAQSGSPSSARRARRRAFSCSRASMRARTGRRAVSSSSSE